MDAKMTAAAGSHREWRVLVGFQKCSCCCQGLIRHADLRATPREGAALGFDFFQAMQGLLVLTVASCCRS